VRTRNTFIELSSYLCIDVRMGPICISNTLRVLVDDKSLALFNLAAFTLSGDASIVMSRLGITRKQYYPDWTNWLILVTRKSSNYFLTSFGKVVYEFHLLIGQAIESYWKLKAIDSIESSIPDSSAEQRKNLIDTLIESSDIKNILLNQRISSDTSKQISGTSKVSNLNVPIF